MSDPFLDLESSAQSAAPRELFEIQINPPTGQVWRHTSATRDIVFSGNRFIAIPVARGEVAVAMPHESETALVVKLPVDHAFVRRYLQQGVPPKQVSVTLYRMQGATTEQLWAGYITSAAFEDSIASFRVPSRAGQWMLRTVPSATISKSCPLILYSTLCGVSRDGTGPTGLAYKVTTTVIYVNGRDIRVDLGSTNRNGSWAEGGEVLHVASGERMSVAAQIDLSPGTSSVADLSMQMQIVGLKIGDAVEIYAGCDWTINGTNGCTPKFSNRQNYGGMPQLSDIDLFIPGSYGPRLVT
jgi:hypothetical protein